MGVESFLGFDHLSTMNVATECPICWNVTADVQLKSCLHAVCSKCLIGQLKHDARCALCRLEFSGIIQILKEVDATHKIRVRADKKGKYGIGLKTDGSNVVVSYVVQGSNAHSSGIRTNDIVSAINGLPCFNTRCTLQILHGIQTSCFVALIEIKREDDAKASSYCTKYLSCLAPLHRR